MAKSKKNAKTAATKPAKTAKTKTTPAKKPAGLGQKGVSPTDALPTIVTTLTHDQIAQRAYDIWKAKGRIPGRDHQNWLDAEAQLRSEHTGK